MFDNPTVTTIVVAAAALILVAIVASAIQRRRQAAEAAQRRERLREVIGQRQLEQREIEHLAGRIIATSSTRTIAGFSIVRQIEAVVTDGHPSPARAVEMLKALAAQKGANALINLDSQRLPSGKCTARGDAVIVKPLALRPTAAPPAPPKPEQERDATAS